MYSQSETKLYNGSDKDVSASGGKLTKKESLKVSEVKPAYVLHIWKLILKTGIMGLKNTLIWRSYFKKENEERESIPCLCSL